MFKLTIVIFALVALACVVSAELPGADKPYELEDVNGAGQGKFGRIFGVQNNLEEGNGKYNLGRHDICPDAKTTKQCSQCCEAKGQAARFQHLKVALKLPTIKLGKCICFQRATL